MINDRTKIAIIGNSVAIKMRPKRQSEFEKTFSELLFDNGYQIYNYGRAGTIVTESFKYLDDEIISLFPDYLIVIYGVVEAFPRQTFRYLNNFNIINYYNNRIFKRNFVPPAGFRILGFIIRLMNGLIRRLATALRVRWLWLSQRNFSSAINALCGLVLSETNGRIILVGISRIPTDSGKFSAEAMASISAFNSILKTQSANSSRINYIDLTESLSEEELVAACPDGIHFSAKGHRMLHDAIISILDADGTQKL
jgi:hypothetical protein